MLSLCATGSVFFACYFPDSSLIGVKQILRLITDDGWRCVSEGRLPSKLGFENRHSKHCGTGKCSSSLDALGIDVKGWVKRLSSKRGTPDVAALPTTRDRTMQISGRRGCPNFCLRALTEASGGIVMCSIVCSQVERGPVGQRSA
jgi:hypothetical protein